MILQLSSMSNHVYKLRGHHIDRLVQYWHKLDIIKEILEKARHEKSIKTEKGEVVIKSYDESFYDGPTIERVVTFFKTLSEEPDATIQIVAGTDDICNLCCNETLCNNGKPKEPTEEDKRYLKKYDLNVGDIVQASDIVFFELRQLYKAWHDAAQIQSQSIPEEIFRACFSYACRQFN
jgi:hypothetical protein